MAATETDLSADSSPPAGQRSARWAVALSPSSVVLAALAYLAVRFDSVDNGQLPMDEIAWLLVVAWLFASGAALTFATHSLNGSRGRHILLGCVVGIFVLSAGATALAGPIAQGPTFG